MRRREFIAALTGAAAWPFAAPAQQPRVPVLGLLNGATFDGASDGAFAASVAAIRRGLQETGLVEGQSLAVEYRSADGNYERLPELAAELVRRGATAIIVIGASAPALAAAQAAVTAVPLVYARGSDAVEIGVASGAEGHGESGAGVTAGAASRRLELLLELRPGAKSLLGYLDNSRLSNAFDANVETLTATARDNGRELVPFDAGTAPEIETAFTRMALHRVRALVVGPDAFLIARQEQIVALAAQSALPTIYPARGAVERGGLMSYGVLTDDMYRVAGIYAGRILNGAIPPALPVVLPSRFELVINKATAKSLRITVPVRLLAHADAVIG